jgi:hypothetical protein
MLVMASILEGQLADEVTAALVAAGVPYAITVTRTETIQPPEEWLPPEEITTDYPCRGWVENYDDDSLTGTVIDARDVRVMILTASITIAPTDATDTITVEGRQMSIVNVKRDASGTLFIVQARA